MRANIGGELARRLGHLAAVELGELAADSEVGDDPDLVASRGRVRGSL